jgi:hypothetical protein
VPEIFAMSVLVRDGLGVVALIALFALAVYQSERRTPRWLRRRGYPPPLYLERRKADNASRS